MMDVKRLKIKDLANLDIKDFNKLSADQLRIVNRRLIEAQRKHVKRLEKEDLVSLSETQFKKMISNIDSGKRGKKKSLNQLRNQYTQIKNVYSYDIRKKAIREHNKKIIDSLKEKGVHISQKNLREFFKTVSRIEQMFPEISKLIAEGKYQIMSEIQDVVSNDRIQDKIKYLEQMYKKTLGKKTNDTGTSRNPLNISNDTFRNRRNG